MSRGPTPGERAHAGFWGGSPAMPWADLPEGERAAWERSAAAVAPEANEPAPYDGYRIGETRAALQRAYVAYRDALDRAGGRKSLAPETALYEICRMHGYAGPYAVRDVLAKTAELLGVEPPAGKVA